MYTRCLCSLCMVGVFSSEIQYNILYFCAFRVYFLHLSGTLSELCICTVPTFSGNSVAYDIRSFYRHGEWIKISHEVSTETTAMVQWNAWVKHWTVLNGGQNNFIFYLFIYVGCFFPAFVVLAEHKSDL